jgi:hypothetical protein
MDSPLARLLGALQQGGHVAPSDVEAEIVHIVGVRAPPPVRDVRRADPGTRRAEVRAQARHVLRALPLYTDRTTEEGVETEEGCVMSQAHYARCDSDICTQAAVARLVYFRPEASILACREHLDMILDNYADEGKFFRHVASGPEWFSAEPRRIEWVYDAGTRVCGVHLWPEILCADWPREEHRASMERIRRRTLEQPST